MKLRFGNPLRPAAEETLRDFNDRIRRAVLTLIDEDDSTWWQSLRRTADDKPSAIEDPPEARWRRIWQASARPATRQRRGAWRS